MAADDELVEPQGEAPPQHYGGEPRHDGERRRRRGRRGGRRRRRNGDMANHGGERGPYEQPQEFTPDERLIATQAPEPEPKEAVADLDAAPRPAAPAPDVPETAQPAPAEPPRRRSTVRERAPVGGGEAPSPQTEQPAPPEPVITEAGEGTDRPRRSGWWSRRFAGG